MSAPLTGAPLEQAIKLCEYIRNTGKVPLRVDDFDDDWVPCGEMYRDQLLAEGFIEIREPIEPSEDQEGQEGGIFLTPDGEALAQ